MLLNSNSYQNSHYPEVLGKMTYILMKATFYIDIFFIQNTYKQYKTNTKINSFLLLNCYFNTNTESLISKLTFKFCVFETLFLLIKINLACRFPK